MVAASSLCLFMDWGGHLHLPSPPNEHPPNTQRLDVIAAPGDPSRVP